MNQDGNISFAFGQGATPAGDFAPLPVGEYRCFVESVTEGTTTTPKDKLTTILVVTEGPHQGRKFWEHTTMSQDAENFVMAYFQALGVNAQPGAQIQCRTSDLVGRTCIVKVTGHHEHQGKQQVDFIMLPDNRGPQPGAMAPQAAPPAQAPQQQTFPGQAAPPQPGFGQGGGIPIERPVQAPPQVAPAAPQQSPQQGGVPNPPF